MKRALLVVVLGMSVSPVAIAASPTPVEALGARYLAQRLEADPTLAYGMGVKIAHHDGMPDESPRAVQKIAAAEDRLWDDLHKIQPTTESDRAKWAVLEEALAGARRQRVCNLQLWSVNHYAGWQIQFGQIAERQPVGTPQLRAETLKRWEKLPGYLKQHTENLRTGLGKSYSAPKAVVQRVVQQLDGILALDVEASPFYAPAKRDTDPAFRAKMRTLVADKINPAVRAYRQFLVDTYLPKARDTLGLSSLPDGRACYAALLQNETTLPRTPEQVFELGQKTVAANRVDITTLGKSLFGTDSFEEILKRTADAPENHFTSEDEFLTYSNHMLERAQARTGAFFEKLPDQPVVIEPMPAYLAGTGTSAHYVPDADRAKPGAYVIPLAEWRKESKGTAEITLVHEALPGHHLQIALARETAADLAGLSENGAYIEGWARYSERLAEEAGIYETPYARISRRVWPAWGMVVDPGIHALNWTREQAVDALVSSGRFDKSQAEMMVDRIAALPGQLTSYDSGGLEIMALRREAEAKLGDRFNIKRFHERILSAGPLPLSALRLRVEAWIDAGGK